MRCAAFFAGSSLYPDERQEAFIRPLTKSEGPAVEYHVLLSLTYRVPVLYFALRDTVGSVISKIDEVYQSLVPDEHRNIMQNSGVIGAISMAV